MNLIYIATALITYCSSILLLICLLAKPFDQQPIGALEPVCTRLDKLITICFFTTVGMMIVLALLTEFTH